MALVPLNTSKSQSCVVNALSPLPIELCKLIHSYAHVVFAHVRIIPIEQHVLNVRFLNADMVVLGSKRYKPSPVPATVVSYETLEKLPIDVPPNTIYLGVWDGLIYTSRGTNLYMTDARGVVKTKVVREEIIEIWDNQPVDTLRALGLGRAPVDEMPVAERKDTDLAAEMAPFNYASCGNRIAYLTIGLYEDAPTPCLVLAEL